MLNPSQYSYLALTYSEEQMNTKNFQLIVCPYDYTRDKYAVRTACRLAVQSAPWRHQYTD